MIIQMKGLPVVLFCLWEFYENEMWVFYLILLCGTIPSLLHSRS